jgi:hypothetical protein
MTVIKLPFKPTPDEILCDAQAMLEAGFAWYKGGLVVGNIDTQKHASALAKKYDGVDPHDYVPPNYKTGLVDYNEPVHNALELLGWRRAYDSLGKNPERHRALELLQSIEEAVKRAQKHGFLQDLNIPKKIIVIAPKP